MEKISQLIWQKCFAPEGLDDVLVLSHSETASPLREGAGLLFVARKESVRELPRCCAWSELVWTGQGFIVETELLET